MELIIEVWVEPDTCDMSEINGLGILHCSMMDGEARILIDYEEACTIMDALWKFGFRPSKSAKAAS